MWCRKAAGNAAASGPAPLRSCYLLRRHHLQPLLFGIRALPGLPAPPTHTPDLLRLRSQEKSKMDFCVSPKKQDTKEKQTTIDSPEKVHFQNYFSLFFFPLKSGNKKLDQTKGRRFQIRLLISSNVSLRPLNATTGITGEEIQAQWIFF